VVSAVVGWAIGLNLRGVRRRADLFVTYVAGYFLGRLWVESLRIDTANTIVGLRLNEWVAIIVVLGALATLRWRGRSGEPRPIEVGSGSIAPPVANDDQGAAGSTDAAADTTRPDPGGDAPDHVGDIEPRAASDQVASSTADEVAEPDAVQPES
jgi:hypothetical protein